MASSSAMLVAACGSSEDKKSVRGGEAGAGGSPAGEEGGASSNTAGDAQLPGDAGQTTDGGAPAFAGTAGATSAGAPSSAGEGGAGTPAGSDLYVSPTGSDEAAGTLDAPFLTIAHAAGLAVAGDRIRLLDGTFDETTQTELNGSTGITIPAGVSVVALNAGQATLAGGNPSAHGLSLQGSAEISGITFESLAPALSARAGNVHLEGIQLAGCGDGTSSPLELKGTANVTLEPGTHEEYVTALGSKYFATLEEQASLTVAGGRITHVDSGASNGRGIFHALGESSVILDGVTVEDPPAETILAAGTAQVTLKGGTLIDGTLSPALAVVELQDSSTLIMDQASIFNSYWAGISNVGASQIQLKDAEISSSGSWGIILNAPGPVTLTLLNSAITDSALNNIDVRTAAELDIAGSRITGSAGRGITLGGAVVHLKVRDTEITGNAAGIQNSGAAGSTCDLGTVDSPGGNDFSGNDTAGAGLLSYLEAPSTTYAVGNTWNPNEQGASASGTYSVNGAGAKLDVTGQVTAGGNYRVFGVGAVLRLAENP